MTKTKLVWFYFLLISLLSTGVVDIVHGQTIKKRKYANFQGYGTGLLGGTLNNANRLLDGDPKTAATLGALLLSETVLYLGFSTDGSFGKLTTLPTGTDITIKFSLPQELLGVGTGITIGTFSGLGAVLGGKYNAATKNVYHNQAALLGLLNGYGVFEYTLTTKEASQGIYLALSTVLSLGLSVDVYHAFIKENSTAIDCDSYNKPLDVLSGVKTGVATALSAANNPYNVMNDDPNSFASINIVAGALGSSFLTTIFPTPAVRPQMVRMVLERPGGLLDLDLLGGFSIKLYNGTSQVGSVVEASQFLSLRLLAGSSGKVEVYFRADALFDRVEINVNSTVKLLSSLNVYEIRRYPYLSLFPEEQLKNKLTACEKVDLKNAIDEIDLVHYTYKYYAAETGGTALGSSIVNSSGTYYIEVVDKETSCISFRRLVVANVLPIPGKPHLTIQNVIN